jgi:hypothetical protein
VDRFQDEAAVEAPCEGAEVAPQMLGADHTVGGQEAVLDVGQHRIRPAKGRVACSSATGTSDMALMDDARLLGNAAKPLAAVADDGGSGRDLGAQAFGFAGAEPAHDLQAGVEWPSVRSGLEIPSRRPSSMLDRPFLPWASRCMARNHTRIGSLVPCRIVPAISDAWYRHRRH